MCDNAEVCILMIGNAPAPSSYSMLPTLNEFVDNCSRSIQSLSLENLFHYSHIFNLNYWKPSQMTSISDSLWYH